MIELGKLKDPTNVQLPSSEVVVAQREALRLKKIIDVQCKLMWNANCLRY